MKVRRLWGFQEGLRAAPAPLPTQASGWAGTRCHSHPLTHLLLAWGHWCKDWTGTHRPWPRPPPTMSAPGHQCLHLDCPQATGAACLQLSTPPPPPRRGTSLLYIYFLPLTTKESQTILRIAPLTINDPRFVLGFSLCILALSSNCWGQGRITSSWHSPWLILHSRSIPASHQPSLKSSIGKADLISHFWSLRYISVSLCFCWAYSSPLDFLEDRTPFSICP